MGAVETYRANHVGHAVGGLGFPSHGKALNFLDLAPNPNLFTTNVAFDVFRDSHDYVNKGAACLQLHP